MPEIASPLHANPASPAEFLALLAAYVELLNACWEAREQNLPARDQPVSISRLRRLGISDELLLWMLFQAHIEHLTPSATGTTHDPANEVKPSVRLTAASMFALTTTGESFADMLLALSLLPADDDEFQEAWSLLQLGQLVPHFDGDQRIFTWGQHLIKQFRQPSPNQETLLRSAEELLWPEWMDDPLPRKPKKNPKLLLRDTIKNLNRNQLSHFVHFKGDGTGTRVGWELRIDG